MRARRIDRPFHMRCMIWALLPALGACTAIPLPRSPYPADTAGLRLGEARTSQSAEPNPAISSLLEPAPEIFEAKGRAVWDGKRTLQGIWVAHPLAGTARRVRIYNTDNGLAVDGALFKSAATLGNTAVLVSSEAAQQLGMEVGRTVELRIVAVKPAAGEPAAADDGIAASEDAAAAPEDAAAAPEDAAAAPEDAATAPEDRAAEPEEAGAPARDTAPATAAGEDIAALPDDAEGPDAAAAAPPAGDGAAPAPGAPGPSDAEPPAAQSADGADGASDAPDEAGQDGTIATSEPAAGDGERTFKWEEPPQTGPLAKTDADAAAKPARDAKAKPATRLRLPYVQAGTFGVEANADRLVRRLKRKGIPALGRTVRSGDRVYTRVLAGPFTSVSARNRAQRAIRAMGLADARPVRR